MIDGLSAIYSLFVVQYPLSLSQDTKTPSLDYVRTKMEAGEHTILRVKGTAVRTSDSMTRSPKVDAYKLMNAIFRRLD